MTAYVAMGATIMLVLAIAACTPQRDQDELFAPGDVDLLVVDAVLIVGQPHPALTLTRTLAPDVIFTPETAAEVGATISVVSDFGVVEYGEALGTPGRYGPMGPEVLIVPEADYELRVETLAGEILTAQTTTPAPFSVDEWVLLDSDGTEVVRRLQTFADAGDSVYYQPENQIVYTEGLLEARFASGGAAVFGGEGYQLALLSIDLGSDYVVEPPFFEDEDFEDLTRAGSSPALAAENGLVRLPWFGVFYQGRYLYKVYALDRNWYDLVRSTPQTDGGLGFGGNVGDSTGRPLFRIDGGIGLFGSASVDSVGFFVLPTE